MSRTFKQMLATSEVMRVFCMARIFHPMIIDVIGRNGGFHGFWFDQEHAGATTEQIAMAALAARANNMDMIVRMPPSGYWQVTQCLEAGAGGVMAAQIQSAEHARQFISWCKFAPEGTRGLNSSGCDGHYTLKPQGRFILDANCEQVVVIQIETVGALQEVEQIAALPGVDMLFVGPSDLSLALGVVGEFHHEKLWQAIERIAAACRSAGITWGCVSPDAAFAQRAIELGCRMPSVCNEVILLRRGIESVKSAFAGVFA